MDYSLDYAILSQKLIEELGQKSLKIIELQMVIEQLQSRITELEEQLPKQEE